jgi:hypothetical protein
MFMSQKRRGVVAANPFHIQSQDKSDLRLACLENNVELLEKLLQDPGVDLDARDKARRIYNIVYVIRLISIQGVIIETNLDIDFEFVQ